LTLDADTGGSPILSYHLQWNAGSLTDWYDLQGYAVETTSTTFTVTTGVVAGTTYDFKVRAKNIYDWGDFSAITQIEAS